MIKYEKFQKIKNTFEREYYEREKNDGFCINHIESLLESHLIEQYFEKLVIEDYKTIFVIKFFIFESDDI